jgi:hypothetical protein
MSLIACIAPDRHPVLLVDALLSSRVGRAGVVLPSVGNQHSQIQSKTEFKTWGFDEKLIRISDHLLVAWAGEHEPASRIVRGVANYIKEDPTTRFEVDAYVRASFPHELPRVSLIFCLRERTINTTWHYGCKEVLVPYIGRIFYAGSGSTRFLSHLDRLPKSLAPEANALMQGLSTALFLGGFLLADEMFTGEPIAMNFGGAYEIATIAGGKALKLDNYSYVFWFGEKDPTGHRFNLAKIMRRYERNDQTCYHCVEFGMDGTNLKVAKEEVFIWKRFLTDQVIRHTESDIPVLNTEWQINVFCFRAGAVGCELAVCLRRREKDRPHVLTFKHDARRELSVGIDLKKIRSLIID